MEFYYVIIAGIFALLFALLLARNVMKEDSGTPEMRRISKAIQEGAMAFLKREYYSLGITILVIAALISVIFKPSQAITFIVGSIVSSFTAWMGMTVSTRANARSAYMASKSFGGAFKIGFSSGAVMGMTVVGAGILGLTIIWLIIPEVELLVSYAFGSSLSALFLRVGGGIYTKSADVGSDMVGKVEAGIPEDDPRNPGVIADAVGDNVGDVAGMGSDLFESYVSSITAAIFLGSFMGENYIVLPLLLAAVGIVSSIIGAVFVRVKEGKNESFEQQTDKVRKAMNFGIILANLLMVIASYFVIVKVTKDYGIFYALLSGLAAGLIIGWSTIYYTSDRYNPVLSIAKASQTGTSTVLIEGLAQGMMSTIIPVLSIAVAMVTAYFTGGLYGIAIAGVGILGVLGVNLACDCYGPIVDNAAGIAEMCHMEKSVRNKCDALDSVGNSTAAMGKGFAIGSAALTALAWLAAFYQSAKLEVINLTDVKVMAGLFLGALLVFLFSALTIKAVSRGAYYVVGEVRRQWKEIPGLMEGKALPNYAKCVDITTRGALKEMTLPGLLAVIVPLVVGYILGLAALGAVLASSLIVGFIMALFMSNSGGAWDNAKKYIESGKFGGKGSPSHKAAVVGDTVGDPLKDTSGPAINIFIKILGSGSLLLIPLLLRLLR